MTLTSLPGYLSEREVKCLKDLDALGPRTLRPESEMPPVAVEMLKSLEKRGYLKRPAELSMLGQRTGDTVVVVTEAAKAVLFLLGQV